VLFVYEPPGTAGAVLSLNSSAGRGEFHGEQLAFAFDALQGLRARVGEADS
jgi:hypothetical protein